ncbi:peptidoglycan-binding domain-containing protein [Luteibacter sp. 329MFSha]|uniref:peptidoglycan-binding domain-containing protein n=1 Tax=Luteibacter sp. 329MFSha TaxID=1798239 RepID=UPI0008D5AA0F|nr:peptidoglycan-binding domain-containing protein [Luteibacter sp. 329MFSha]SEW13446.1 Putative peptidoglycan binding domain-containing protein [Luteibacter sp. 329MFSha]
MAGRKALNAQELRAIAYFAVGVASEGTLREKDVAATLSFAGTRVNGKMDPMGNSGLSIGTLQKDLGQDKKKTAREMVAAYREWAARSPDWPDLSDADVVASVADLSRNGRAIRDQGGRDIDPSLQNQLSAFLASKDGRNFVHARDVDQVEHIRTHALVEIVDSVAYKNATVDEQIIIATIVAKAFNQNQTAGKGLYSAMKAPHARDRSLDTLDDVLSYAESHHKRYLASGREHALVGAKVLTRLHNADENSPIGRAWREVLADPLVRPTEIGADPDRPDLAAHYTLIKNLFHAPKQAMAFLDALEQGRPYHEGKITGTGFYTDGTQIVQWNADGKGVTFVEGQWATVSRDELGLTRARDGSVDLARVVDSEGQPLLHVEPAVRSVAAAAVERALRPGVRGDDVRQLQEQLMRLGYSDAQGRPLRADGDYGPGTQAAVRAFQREHDLVADGLSGRQTLASVRQAVHDRDASIAAAHRPHDEVMAAYRAIDPVMGAAAGRSTPVEARVDARATSETMSTYQSLEPVTRTAAPPIAPVESPLAREPREPVAMPTGREAPAADASLAPRRAPSDPRHADHPQNGLYELLKTQIPDASENRLLQTTAACHRSRITAENLSMVHINEETMTLHVFGHGPMTLPARVDLNHPSPAPEQSVERMAQFDLQQAQVLAEIQAQQAQMSRGMSR